MTVTGIPEMIHQYEKTVEDVLKNKPKHSKEYGIKRPDTRNIIVVLAGLVLVAVIVSQLM